MENSSRYTINSRIEKIKSMMKNVTANGFANVINNRILKPKANIANVLKELGGETFTFKTAGASGLTFKSSSLDKNIQFAIKVVAFNKRSDYGDIFNEGRPENAELKTIYLLSQFVLNHSIPHIVLPMACFNTDIMPFVTQAQGDILDDKKYKKFIEAFKEDKFENDVSILISEWVNYGDLLNYMRKRIDKTSDIQWKVILFQIISTLSVIHLKYPTFRHNDMKANNILLQKLGETTDEAYEYKINKKRYLVPIIGAIIKLWDFDFACIPGIVENNKVSSTWAGTHYIHPKQNRYYDLHYFMNSLTKESFIPNFWSRVQPETKKFFERIIPPEYRYTDDKENKGRLKDDIEYVTPLWIIENDPYFAEFRNSTSTGVSQAPKVTSKMTYEIPTYIDPFVKETFAKETFAKETPEKKKKDKDEKKKKKDAHKPIIDYDSEIESVLDCRNIDINEIYKSFAPSSPSSCYEK